MPGDPDRDQNLRARMAHLEDEFDRLSQANQLLQGALANVPGPTRRQALSAAAIALGASAGGVGFLAGQESARADAVGQVGVEADPLTKLWTHALEVGDGQQLIEFASGHDEHFASKSSAYTTAGESVYDCDTSISGFTLTLASADAVAGHWKLIRNDGGNTLTYATEGAETIDGSATVTNDKDGGVDVLFSDGSNWFTTRFTDTVNARQVTAGEVNNGGSDIDLGDVLNRLDMSKGSTGVLAKMLGGDGGGLELRGQETDGVSTSATVILQHETIAAIGGSVSIVVGDERASTNRFMDVVTFLDSVAPTSQHSETEGSPAGRTYSRSGNDLQLAMASGTYDVAVAAVLARRNTNATS